MWSSNGVTRRRRVVAGALIVVFAVPVGVMLTRWPGLQAWSDSLDSVVHGRGGPWRLTRGVLAYAAIPALLGAGAAVVVLTWRRSPRDGLVLFGAMAAANVVIQVIKHPLAWSIPAVEMLDPLSGHVGVSGAVALGWALSVRRERRASAAVAAVGVISLVGVGVVLAGWHSLAQVLCPLLIVLGGMIIADGLMSPPRGSTARTSRWPGVLTVPVGALVAAVSLAVALGGPRPTDETEGLAVLCLVGTVVGLVSAGVGVLFLAAPALAHATASPSASSAPSTAQRRPP